MNKRILLGIGVALVALVAIGVFALQPGGTLSPKPVQAPSETPHPPTRQPTVSPSVVPPSATPTPPEPCASALPTEEHVDREFAYSIQYPLPWHIEAYEVGERIGTGSPGPEYMIAMATVEGNFGSDFSSEDDVVRVFISRAPKDPALTLEEYEGPVVSTLPNFRRVTIGGLSGFQWEERPVGDGWGGFYAELDLIDFVISFEGQIRGGETFSMCRDSVMRTISSFAPLE